MRKKVFPLCMLLLGTLLVPSQLKAQGTEVLKLSLEEVIRIAKEQSPSAILAKHRFRASYWEYRTFRAEYRPSLTLEGSLPDYTREFEKEFDFSTNREEYVEKNTISTDMELSLSQNIGLTGGSIFVTSDLTRLDVLGSDGSRQFVSTPVSIGFTQPINGFNSLKWEKIIEPLQYDEAKKDYLNSMEQVALTVTGLFFDLVLAEQNLDIARTNYDNSDTLYTISEGRYNIGTIAENELLQMELSLLNSGTDLNQASIDLQIAEFDLRSYLGYNENVHIELIIPNSIPELEIEVTKAIQMARENSPDLVELERELKEAERDVAEAKSEKGFSADLYASFGLTQQADEFRDAYNDLSNQQMVNVGFSLPIVDWGLGRGNYKMAQSSQEVTRTSVQQSLNDFEQNVILNVMSFNLQDDQVGIAAKADTIAQKRYDVTKERYLIGKIDVLDLNVAMEEKDVAKRGYITALRNYWEAFFTVRQICLFDFENQETLSADFDLLVE